ncbi:MAG TPA: TonB-dependent receptor plug domain-containing protein [Opitutaceae bacterium]|nr:TonB-dependent receptor plug domain-containing protein [Opitutaceae bacterium]
MKQYIPSLGQFMHQLVSSVVLPMLFLVFAVKISAQTKPVSDNIDEEVVTLQPFSVEAKEDASGYGVTSATSVTRLNTALRDIPQTVNIAGERMIKELAAPTLGEAVAFLPGVTMRNGGQDQFQVRSIDVNSQFRNSYRYTTGSSLHFRKDMANIDRIEVIKGLGSATTGRGEAGGVVNLVTKKPQSRKATSIRFTVDDYGYHKSELDMTGPLTSDGRILYRAITSYTGGETYLPNNKYDTIAFFPSIHFRFNERTDLLIEGSMQSGATPSAEFFEIQDEFQFFFRAPNGQVFRTFPEDGALHKTRMMPKEYPQTASWVEPDAQAYDVFVQLNHKFTDWLSTRQGLLWVNTQVDRELTRLRGFGSYIFDPANPLGPPIDWTMALRHDTTERDIEFISYQGDFLLEYEFARMTHQTLLGYELTWRDVFDRFKRANTGAVWRILDNSAFLALKRSDLPAQAVSTHETRDVEETSYYIQHTAKAFDDRLQITGGWRYDKIKEDIINRSNNTFIASRPEPTDKTWRVGAGFRVLPSVTLFAVHAEQQDPTRNVLRYPEGTFGVAGRDPSERISAARTVELDEIGLKSELFGGKFTFNVSYYKILEGSDIRSVNFRTNRNDEISPQFNWRENVADPSATSEGVEIELSGAPTDRLSFYASAAFAKTAIFAVQSDQSVVKRRQRGDTPVRLNLMGNYLAYRESNWNMYVQSAFGYTDDVVLNPDNIVLQSGSFRWDLGVRIARRSERGSWEAQFRVQNVLDEYIITGTANSGTMPRRFVFSIERRF